MNFVTKYRFVAAVFMQQFSQCDILSQSDLEWGGISNTLYLHYCNIRALSWSSCFVLNSVVL